MAKDANDELTFNELTLMQRHAAALKQATAVVKQLVPFLVTLQPGPAPDPKVQRDSVSRALATLQDLLRILLLDDLLQASFIHRLGPSPAVDAPEDVLNLRAIQELHILLDWLAPIVQVDSFDAGRADLHRLEQRHTLRTLRRDHYADPRKRDALELAEREFAVLLTHFVAAARQVTIQVLLARLGVGYDAFRKWAAEVDREQRDLMDTAGTLSITDGGLTLAQAAQLSDRSRGVLLRDDPDRFPELAGLSDEDKLRKLFALVRRSGSFSRD